MPSVMKCGYLATAGLIGICIHLWYFRYGEHHLYPWRYVRFHLCLTMGVSALLYAKKPPQYTLSPGDLVKDTCLLMVTYLIGLFTSLLLYRTLFHPLRQIRGPWAAKVSSFWLSFRLRRGPSFRILHELHEEYGPVVRVGPSEVSIIHPEAIGIIYGPNSRCSKNAFYDNGHPMMSLHSYRDRTAHDQRRRVWSAGFGDRALRGYEQRMRVYRQKLFQRLEERADAESTINISQWFNFYSYDTMGDLAFARSFDMLDASRNHWAVDMLMHGMIGYRYLFPSWFFRLLATMPSLSNDWHKFIGFATDTMLRRLREQVGVPDIFASLLAPLNGRDPTDDERNMLMGDAMLIITAGSDTTATSLTSIVYELARRPDEVDKLRAEIEPIEADSDGEYQHDTLAKLPHLNGFINEAFRLHSPIPGVIPRKTPPEGIHVKDIFIPGNMTVFSPQWSMGRSEAAYVDPAIFNPERWYKHIDLVKEKSVFAPFSIGPYSCIGKPLAMMNIRTTVARLIMRFDVRFPEGEDGIRWMDAADEHFAMGIHQMPVVLTRRH
ncbi:cytochrome P450 monooxygenase ftmC [Aspergillus fischeri NRRL 181]|uniref:Tryprostatin B 6-hydroxylase n=1 Tax=Neosartorya fischeri (strain ATCC 1020 / DSM 3700 / CBS 544.65 / FGSC A1164 / JCM 1740 / NRRL 181 / WB 181) TaxID=331117 RepID=FTMC_NEOFI|nr:benzoate 4-monooxygenase cytochrome P450 [Aspergillus fischeri NRRL 181]A1DA60.1 RecName: Full=Tryprostatin B 6-hydroxylase; AltName: Full=Fumitremorgin biosynthesis protein C [Aspergillus fischeri NRRL 181]EAW19750.1 benzoate 4-monooxygenase cytochrome P450 [Aspergillus fischeri NRRL 181]